MKTDKKEVIRQKHKKTLENNSSSEDLVLVALKSGIERMGELITTEADLGVIAEGVEVLFEIAIQSGLIEDVIQNINDRA